MVDDLLDAEPGQLAGRLPLLSDVRGLARPFGCERHVAALGEEAGEAIPAVGGQPRAVDEDDGVGHGATVRPPAAPGPMPIRSRSCAPGMTPPGARRRTARRRAPRPGSARRAGRTRTAACAAVRAGR